MATVTAADGGRRLSRALWLGALLAIGATVGCAGNTGVPPVATDDLSMCGTPACLNLCNADGDCGGVRKCDTDHHVCVDCLADADCPASAVCRALTHTCAPGCSQTRQCAGDGGSCELDAGVCVECLADADCTSPDRPRCLAPAGHCVPCLLPPAKSNCDPGHYCAAVGTDTQCLSGCADDSDCGSGMDGGLADGGTGVRCDRQMHRCVSCAADTDCPASQICTNGQCVEGCSQTHGCENGLACCNAACSDITSDSQNCGGCGAACKGGWLCCNSACFNPASDTLNCGGCGTVCQVDNGTPACVGRACAVGGCDAGWADCNGVVRDGCETHTDVNPANCGSCGNFCSFPRAQAACKGGACVIDACLYPFADCDGQAANGCETNLGSDIANCGGCGVGCMLPHATPACSQSLCRVASCQMGFANCNFIQDDGCEARTDADPKNCGGCGAACSGNHISNVTCGLGMCDGACDPGFGDCNANKLSDGCEAALLSDPANCGGCGVMCGGPHATTACSLGACKIVGCDFGWGDCNGNPQDGCEVNLLSDQNNCGTCKAACSNNHIANPGCGLGLCNGNCDPGFSDCNNDKLHDGCETNSASDVNNCGGCGMVCPGVANGVAGCANGACGLGACNANFGNCDNNPGNGCETNLANDPNNCGACAHVCGGGQNCNGGVCIQAAPQWVFANYNGGQTFFNAGSEYNGQISCPMTCGFIGLHAVGVRFVCNSQGQSVEGCNGGNQGQYGNANCGRYIDEGVNYPGTNGEDCSSGLASCVAGTCSEGVTYHAIQCECM